MTKNGLYQTFRVKTVIGVNYRTKTLVFDNDLPHTSPGQFVMAWLPEVGERPYSISSSAPFGLTVVGVGNFSEALLRLKAGDRLWVRGPLGNGFQLQGRNHLLVGGGYGSAPLLFLAKKAREQGDAVHICLGARTAQDVVLAEMFQQIGCTLSIATDDGSLGTHGLVTHIVASTINNSTIDTLYGCGPLPMLTALATLCRSRMICHQLSWEALMRCGIGLCGSCELDENICQQAGIPSGWLACKDGPVFYHPGVE